MADFTDEQRREATDRIIRAISNGSTDETILKLRMAPIFKGARAQIDAMAVERPDAYIRHAGTFVAPITHAAIDEMILRSREPSRRVDITNIMGNSGLRYIIAPYQEILSSRGLNPSELVPLTLRTADGREVSHNVTRGLKFYFDTVMAARTGQTQVRIDGDPNPFVINCPTAFDALFTSEATRLVENTVKLVSSRNGNVEMAPLPSVPARPAGLPVRAFEGAANIGVQEHRCFTVAETDGPLGAYLGYLAAAPRRLAEVAR